MPEELKHCEVCGVSEVESQRPGKVLRRYVVGVKTFNIAGRLESIGDYVHTTQCSECWVASLGCIKDASRGLMGLFGGVDAEAS